MGNKQSCCIYHSPKGRSKKGQEVYQSPRPVDESHQLGQHHGHLLQTQQSTGSLTVPQHISEREPEGLFVRPDMTSAVDWALKANYL